MNKQNIILITVILILGAVTPFIGYAVIIQFMFLLIPFGLFILGSFIYLIYCIVKSRTKLKGAIIAFLTLPLFFITQSLSVIAVDSIQRTKSEALIQTISSFKSLPKKIDTPLGIKYSPSKDLTSYNISYSRGFLVTEVFNSVSAQWNSFGWND